MSLYAASSTSLYTAYDRFRSAIPRSYPTLYRGYSESGRDWRRLVGRRAVARPRVLNAEEDGGGCTLPGSTRFDPAGRRRESTAKELPTHSTTHRLVAGGSAGEE